MSDMKVTLRFMSHLFLGILALVNVSVHGFDLAIFHTNDVHARVEQFNKYAGPCSQNDADNGNCFGGFPRLKTKVTELRNTHINSLFLDGGNMLGGSTWFFKFGGSGLASFMNYLGYDAMVLGNHEFSKGDAQLIPFLDGVNFPVVSANIRLEPDSPLTGKFVKSQIVTVGGERIGLIGYTNPITPEISNPGDHVSFRDEVAAVKEEVATLTGLGVNKIIVLGHSGLEREMEVAAQVDGIDVIVGGHNNKFLYNGDSPSVEPVYGDYPQIVTQANGAKVLIVYSYAYAKYLGELHLVFDQNGVVTSWYGNPVLLDNSVSEDSSMLQFLAPFKAQLEAELDVVVGQTHVYLEGTSSACRSRECNLGNLIADAFVRHNVKSTDHQWTNVSIAIVNGGSIRSSILKGDITLGKVTTVLPFGSSIDIVELRGADLIQMLEHSVSEHDKEGLNTWGGFLQVSGLKIEYDLSQPVGSRVRNARALCTRCDIPRYEDIQSRDTYRVIVSSFLAKGGDRYDVIRDKRRQYIVANYLDLNIFVEYLQNHSPVIQGEEGRIVFVPPKMPCIVTYPSSPAATVSVSPLGFALLLLVAISRT